MPEGFNKVSDLKIVISAATGPLQEGIKDAQALIRSFSTDGTGGLGMIDAALGKVSGSVGVLAGRLNVAMGALAAAGGVIQQVMAVGEQVANNLGAEKEFGAVRSAIDEVQSALVDLAGFAFQVLQKEAAHAAASLVGFETATANADGTAENFAQRTLKKLSAGLEEFAQTVREKAPLDVQSYNTLAISLERIDERIKQIE